MSSTKLSGSSKTDDGGGTSSSKRPNRRKIPNAVSNASTAATTDAMVTTTTTTNITSTTEITNNNNIFTNETTVELDHIDAIGVTALIGYEAETNHAVGLCTATRTDYHFHMALARTNTDVYRTRNKHRLLYACITGNVAWFRALWRGGNENDMVNLMMKSNDNLAHNLLRNAKPSTPENFSDTRNRLEILRFLFESSIDMTHPPPENSRSIYDTHEYRNLEEQRNVSVGIFRSVCKKFTTYRYWLSCESFTGYRSGTV